MFKCPKCNEVKDVSEFYIRKDGYRSGYCKECTKTMVKDWVKNNREKANASWRKWRADHADQYNAQVKRYRESNPSIKLAADGRSLLTGILRGRTSSKRFLVEIVGFENRETLIGYLKSTNQTGLDFDTNYGDKLVIDHIIPCSAFDLTKPEEYKLCFHHRNLRIVTKTENASKGNKII